MSINDNELNHLIWYFSLSKKEKDFLNTLPNNIKGGLDWMSLRGGKAAEVTPIASIAPESMKAKVAGKKGRKKGSKAKAPVVAVKDVAVHPVKKGRGRPKKV